MNIGIVTTWFERGAAYVSKQYEKLLSKNNNVYIYARGGERKAIGIKEWDADNVHWATRDYVTSVDLSEFEEWINKNKIECVLFNEQQNWQVILLCNKKGVKCGAYIDYYTEETVPFFKHYDFIICNTKRHFSVFSKYPQCYYVPWGTDVNLFKPSSCELVCEDKVTFYNSAGFDPKRKGTLQVIEAFSKLCEKYGDEAELIIHTQVDIPDVDGCIDRILSTHDNIKLINKTVTAPGLFFMGDVYVYPSELDGIGLTVAEAIASGLPVIVTGCGPMNEFGCDDIRKEVDIESYYSRGDGYYWPLAKIDTNSLYEQMCFYVENKKDVPNLKRRAREYAVEYLDWNNNEELLNHIFNSSKILEHSFEDEQKINRYDRSRLPMEVSMRAYFYQLNSIKNKFNIYRDKEVYLYPAGKMTQLLLDVLPMNEINISGILDKKEIYVNGIKTTSPNTILHKDNAVVLLTSSILEKELKEELISNIGFKGIIDTCFIDSPDINNISFLKENDLILNRMDLVLTTRCSLRCEKCANLMQYYSKHVDVDFEVIVKSMGKLISVVDEIKTIYVIGGEPFLYNKLSDVVHFLKRFDKIKEIVIITNGTLLPAVNAEELWAELSDAKVKIQISDYGTLSNKKDEIFKVCALKHVNVEILESKVFYDTGKMNKRNRTIEDLNKVFVDCSTQCRSLYNGELHFCPRSSHGTDLGIVEKRIEDYVDLLCEENDYITREKVKSLHNKASYVQACDHCDIRVDGYYDKEYPAAEQTSTVLSVE